MIRIVHYRISLVEELECIKREKAECKAERMINDYPPSVTSLDYGVLAGNWEAIFLGINLNPSALDLLSFVENPPIVPNSSLSSK
jgi:hypothetical protein